MPKPEVLAAELGGSEYLLDVREDDEWIAGHAPQAVHLPMMTVPARLGDVPADQEVVVVCRSGIRSAQVVAYLRAHGYDNVANLADGMQGWARAGRPMVCEQPGVPTVI
jgi:rhodanese-related sulfurtransferase